MVTLQSPRINQRDLKTDFYTSNEPDQATCRSPYYNAVHQEVLTNREQKTSFDGHFSQFTESLNFYFLVCKIASTPNRTSSAAKRIIDNYIRSQSTRPAAIDPGYRANLNLSFILRTLCCWVLVVIYIYTTLVLILISHISKYVPL